MTLGRESAISAILFLIGFSPIMLLCFAIFGWLPLHHSAYLLVLSFSLGVFFCLRYPTVGNRAFKGLLCGIVATAVYDLTRFPFVITGHFTDFIPTIGKLLLNADSPNWQVGYLWRYLGNGGGMGLAFGVVLPFLRLKVVSRGALIYGVGIWCCLMGTLTFSLSGQEIMFRLTRLTVAVSLLGHIVYGNVLGSLLAFWNRHEGVSTLFDNGMKGSSNSNSLFYKPQ